MHLKHSVFILLMLSTLSSFAQIDTIVTYYDKYWEKTAIKADASYYRKSWKENNKTYVSDYFMSNGKAQMTGSYIGESDSIKDGHFVYYYQNGWKSVEGDFTNNYETGNWKFYFDNGKLSANLHFMSNIESIKNIAKEKKEDNPNEHFSGINEWYHANGRLSSVEEYANGKLLNAQMFNDYGDTLIVPKDEKGNLLLETPSNVEDAFNDLVKQHLKYPPKALKAKQEGKVKLWFVLESDSSINKIMIVESSGNDLLDNAAVETLWNLRGKLHPPMFHGRLYSEEHKRIISFNIADYKQNQKKKK